MAIQATFDTRFEYGAPTYGAQYAGPAAVAGHGISPQVIALAVAAAVVLFVFITRRKT